MEDIAYGMGIAGQDGTPAQRTSSEVGVLPTTPSWGIDEQHKAYEAERSWRAMGGARMPLLNLWSCYW